MGFMKLMYDVIYRYFRAPWDIGPRQELVETVESGRIKPCSTICLGSGTANNVIFLASKGFRVTAVDFSSAAIDLGRKRAAEAGVVVEFIQDDLTGLQHVHGTYDFLLDYGTLDDLGKKGRDLYMENVLPLAHAGSLFLLYCFEWPQRKWERLYPFPMFMEPGEVQRRFGRDFEIERIAGSEKLDLSSFIAGYAVYLMSRKPIEAV